MSASTAKNRKERRAEAKQNGTAVEPPSTAPKIKMAKPDYGRPKGKTLMDIYEEKRAEMQQGQPFDPKQAEFMSLDEGGNILEAGLGDGEPVGPIGDAVFWATCLTMLHFTLDVLVYSQYAQEIQWPAIFKRSFIMFPILFSIMYILRSDLARRFPTVRQVIFLIMSVAAGCYTIYIGNNAGYFAVMKQAPPLGTIWIWSVIELNLPFALASVTMVFAYLWANGFSAF